MKITLISLDQMIISYGTRLISSCLKQEGFEVEIIFARAVIGQPLSKSVERQITKLTDKSDLIGISLMSNHFLQAISLTKEIKKRVRAPIVWGGVHPTFSPEDSLRYADMICIGEGEKVMVDLAKMIKKNKKKIEVKGIWYKDKAQIIKNGMQSLVEDLDSLPFPDFGPENHFIRDEEKILKMTNNLFEKYLTKRELTSKEYVSEYYVSSSRGCPFSCSYCASNTVKKLYDKQRFFRLRSPEKVIEEIKILTQKYNFIKWIYFSDDDLSASPLERVKKFCDLWKKEIKLPFYATVAPWSYNEEKMKYFLDAGLGVINMGIQTVSKRGGEVFHRIYSKNNLRKIIKSIYKLKSPLPPIYDFILDNPYETDKDKLENLDFILDIPQPKKLQLFSLVPFPGTEIFTKMKNDNLLNDEEKMIYQKCYSYPEANYINMLIYLSSTNFPIILIQFLRNDLFLLMFNNMLSKWIFKNIPYFAFNSVIRVLFNYRFWQFNKVSKGKN